MPSAWWSMVWITSPAILWNNTEQGRRGVRGGLSFARPAQENRFPCLAKKPTFSWFPFASKDKGPEGVQGATGKPPGLLRRDKKRCDTEKSKKDSFPCLPQEIHFLRSPSASAGWAPKVSKGRPESPLVASAEAKSSEKQKKESKGSFPCLPQEIYFFVVPIRFNRVGPEGFQRATGKPFGRLRRGESF